MNAALEDALTDGIGESVAAGIERFRAGARVLIGTVVRNIRINAAGEASDGARRNAVVLVRFATEWGLLGEVPDDIRAFAEGAD
jgi:hypothetical protein